MNRPKANRTYRLRNRVEKYLEKNIEASTGAIFEHINNTTRHGTTMHQLGNCLAKDPRFQKIGITRVKSLNGGNYSQMVWQLREKQGMGPE
tara:strand:+ start:68 stop:340 length:273 start_codon:yes stop_codon:yes gene_type:complete